MGKGQRLPHGSLCFFVLAKNTHPIVKGGCVPMNKENIKVIDRSNGTHLKSEGNLEQRLFPVKEVCEITGLTRKQLFDYKGIGGPSSHDKSGYKLYDGRALNRLMTIAELRRIGMSLNLITQVLYGKKEKTEAIKEQIGILEKQLEAIGEQITLAMQMTSKD